MRTIGTAGQITKIAEGEHPSLFSKLAGMRCPECTTLQPYRKMLATNPFKGLNSTKAHQCANCSRHLFLNGGFGRFGRFLTLHLPAFLLSALIGHELVSHLPLLSSFHSAEGRREPNFFGFIFVLTVIVFPIQTFLLRFDKVGIDRT